MDNFDPLELEKFNALAGRWWDRTGEFRPLHEINPLRIGFIEAQVDGQGGNRAEPPGSPEAERAASSETTGPLAPPSLTGLRVLDIGCGGGILAEGLSALGARVTAIDLADAPLAVARLHAAESGLDIRYEQVSAEDYANQHPGAFDVVTCLEMLEHVPDPGSTVAAAGALTKPGGDLFFATINRNPKAYLFAVLGAEYLLRLLPKGTHEYQKFVRPSELDRFARRAALRLQRLTGMHYNPLTGVYKLGPGVAVNYLAHYRRMS